MSLIVLDATDLKYFLCDRFNLAEGSGSKWKFSCKMIEPGIISYLNTPEKDVVLIRKETIDRCIESARQNPLTLGHIDITNEAPDEDVANGRVIEVRYNAADGWYYVDGYGETEQAKNLIRRGYKPSCAFREKKVAINTTGLRYHGFHYDKEITELEFHHLAIVQRPRFEDAIFRLNSLIPMKSIFTLVRELVTRKNKADGSPELDAAGKPVEVRSTETIALDGDTEVTVGEGAAAKKVRLNDLGRAYMEMTAGAISGADHEVEIPEMEGLAKIRVKLADVVSVYNKHRKNEANAESERLKKEAEEKAQKDRINAYIQGLPEGERAAETARLNSLAPEAREAEIARKNTGFVITLRDAARNAGQRVTDGGYSTSSGSLREKCERGKLKY